MRAHVPFLLLLLMAIAILAGGPAAAEDPEADPKLTEVWEPVPAKITPGEGTAPPSDAIALFDGKDLSAWQHDDGRDVEWTLEDGAVTVAKDKGGIRTRESFGDAQLHIEWRAPEVIEGEGQGRGNSGVYFQGRYEVQVLDSYESRTYSNGQAGSIYKQHIPLVNACLEPGKWQAYDIVFTAPRFADDGSLKSPAYFTVFHNGVLIQNHVELSGPTTYRGEPQYSAHELEQPLSLQDHGNPVSYRNIWIRRLPAPAAMN